MLKFSVSIVSRRLISTRSSILFLYKDKNISIKTPEYKKDGNIITNSLDYVNKVDETRKQIDLIPSLAKCSVLLSRIDGNPELLFFLALFHHELNKIGINQATEDRSKLLWTYRLKYLLVLRKIHGIFFDNCKILGVTEHEHRLGFSPETIGILDPKNFSLEEYTELQSGTFNGTKFDDMQMIGTNPFTSK